MSRALATSLAVFAVLMPGAAVVASAQAPAPGLVTIQKLSAPLANELVGESVAACAQKGYTVTAVVVDLDGVRQALLRGNGAPIHTLDNAFYKAYSAASLTLGRKENSTKEVAGLLGIAFKTASCHRTRLMDKLGVHDLANLVRYAIRERIIQP